MWYRNIFRCGLIVFVAALPRSADAAPADSAAPGAVGIAQAANATVGLIAGEAGSTDARIAADIAQTLADADRLRVLPIQGSGSVQNLADLIFLKGVDVAIVHADALARTAEQGAIPREGSIQYITKLFQEEIHILARKDIGSVNDLAGQPVGVGKSGSGTELTADAVFEALHIDIVPQREPETLAIDRLRHGQIAAMVVVGGKPVPLLQTLPPGTGLHFLPIPLNAALVNTYVPTALDARDYPELIAADHPVDTVAVAAVLVTLATPPDSLRAKRVNRFTDTLFDRFDELRQAGHHPKWADVTLSARFPGWTRYPEARTLLQREAQGREDKLRTAFDAYLSQTGQSVANLTADRRHALFENFMQWRERQPGP